MNFWSDYLENSYQLEDVSTNFDFFTICANHNEQHNGGWKSSVHLKLVIFTISWNKCLTSIYNKLLNFWSFSKVKIGVESKFYKLYFVSYAHVQHRSNSWFKLSFSKYSQFSKSTLHGHPFFLQNLFLRKEGDIPKWFFNWMWCTTCLPNYPKNLGWRIVSLCCPDLFIVIHKPQNGLSSV
jgi:hypothetical protein